MGLNTISRSGVIHAGEGRSGLDWRLYREVLGMITEKVVQVCFINFIKMFLCLFCCHTKKET